MKVPFDDKAAQDSDFLPGSASPQSPHSEEEKTHDPALTVETDAKGPEVPKPAGGLGLDLAALRLTQDFSVEVPVQELLTSVPTHKPDKQWFVRVHPDPTWRLPTAVLEFGEDKQVYLVDASLRAELSNEIVSKVLLTGINRQGTVFIWPVKLPDSDGAIDSWNRSAIAVAQEAQKRWVRVVRDHGASSYRAQVAEGDLPEPVWPSIGFQGILEIAFKDRLISDRNHPVLRALRGE